MWRGRCRAPSLSFTAPECNSFGLALMDAPALEVRRSKPRRTPSSFWKTISTGALPAPIVDAFLARCQHVVVLDHLQTATTAKRNWCCRQATFAESDGTLVSSEGRAQRFFQVFVPPEPIQESWRWLGSWQNAG